MRHILRTLIHTARYFPTARVWPSTAYMAGDQVARLRGWLRGGLTPLHRGEAIRPFFVVGAGRSGTTLMRRILLGNPGLHIPPEMQELGSAIQSFLRNRSLPWEELVELVLARLEYSENFDGFDLSLRPLAIELKSAPPERRSLAAMLDRVYRAHAERMGRPEARWGDKTPKNAFWMPQILAVFPEARFINMVRDGVDVVASWSRAESMRGFSFEQAAHIWRFNVEKAEAFARRRPGRALEVRYERLVADPEGTIGAVCAFIGEPFDPRIVHDVDAADAMPELRGQAQHVNLARPITRDSVGKGRDILTAEQRRELQRLIGPTLKRLGYEAAA